MNEYQFLIQAKWIAVIDGNLTILTLILLYWLGFHIAFGIILFLEVLALFNESAHDKLRKQLYKRLLS
jgi:hypothetical protein